MLRGWIGISRCKAEQGRESEQPGEAGVVSFSKPGKVPRGEIKSLPTRSQAGWRSPAGSDVDPTRTPRPLAQKPKTAGSTSDVLGRPRLRATCLDFPLKSFEGAGVEKQGDVALEIQESTGHPGPSVPAESVQEIELPTTGGLMSIK